MDGVVPRTREEFEKQCANVLSMTLIYFPHHPGYTSAERMSLGEMIVRHRFVWPWTFGHSFRVIQVFMRNHPALFVPGSNAVDMTPLGMPPLTPDLEADLLAARAGTNPQLFHVDMQYIPTTRAEFAISLRFVHGQPHMYVPLPYESPRRSVGQAIMLQRFPSGTSPRILHEFILENVSLFAPGSYHTDMTALGMAPLTPDQAVHVEAERLARFGVAPREFRHAGEPCPICLEPLPVDGSIRLPCGHLQHASCIFRLQPRRCPDCRSDRFPAPSVIGSSVHAEISALRSQVELLNRGGASSNRRLDDALYAEVQALRRQVELLME